jgi:hypothetical protein
MPSWVRVLWTMLILVVGTIIGVIARFVVGSVVNLGIVLGVRVEPLGAFEVSFTNVKGVLLVGVLAGFVPDALRKIIDGWFPSREKDKNGKKPVTVNAGEPVPD